MRSEIQADMLVCDEVVIHRHMLHTLKKQISLY